MGFIGSCTSDGVWNFCSVFWVYFFAIAKIIGLGIVSIIGLGIGLGIGFCYAVGSGLISVLDEGEEIWGFSSILI